MSYIRSDIRALLRQAIDPSSAQFTDAELNAWIAEAVVEISQLMPIRTTHTETITASNFTVSGRSYAIEYVLLDSTYLAPHHQPLHGFAAAHFHAEPLTDTTLFTLGATITSSDITAVYYAPTTQTDSDGADFALPDHLAPLIVSHATAYAWTRRHSKSIIDDDDLALVSRYLIASTDAWNEYLFTLATAVSQWESTTVNTHQL